MDAASETRTSCAVNRLVPFAHVARVDASLAFYALLGFVPKSVMRDGRGEAFWSLSQSGTAEIMLVRASGPVDAERQAVLFYMYSTDLTGLRRHLLAGGVWDGGVYFGTSGPDDQEMRKKMGIVFEISHPHYMPAGELRIVDVDGYVILVGQLG